MSQIGQVLITLDVKTREPNSPFTRKITLSTLGPYACHSLYLVNSHLNVL